MKMKKKSWLDKEIDSDAPKYNAKKIAKDMFKRVPKFLPKKK